jgi:uncharacterized protein YciI
MPPMATYRFGLLRRGPAWTPERTPRTDSLQAGHLANIRRMWELGKLVAAGPFADGGDLRGVLVFRADSIGEARALAAADPAIAAGRLVLDLWDWYAPAGIGDPYRERAARPGHRDSMVTVVFAFLDARAGSGPGGEAEVARDQAAHVRRIFAGLADGTLLSAGPLAGAGERRGVLVFAPGIDLDGARAWAAGDPHVRSGRLRLEPLRWWVADGVFR